MRQDSARPQTTRRTTVVLCHERPHALAASPDERPVLLTTREATTKTTAYLRRFGVAYRVASGGGRAAARERPRESRPSVTVTDGESERSGAAIISTVSPAPPAVVAYAEGTGRRLRCVDDASDLDAIVRAAPSCLLIARPADLTLLQVLQWQVAGHIVGLLPWERLEDLEFVLAKWLAYPMAASRSASAQPMVVCPGRRVRRRDVGPHWHVRSPDTQEVTIDELRATRSTLAVLSHGWEIDLHLGPFATCAVAHAPPDSSAHERAPAPSPRCVAERPCWRESLYGVSLVSTRSLGALDYYIDACAAVKPADLLSGFENSVLSGLLRGNAAHVVGSAAVSHPSRRRFAAFTRAMELSATWGERMAAVLDATDSWASGPSTMVFIGDPEQVCRKARGLGHSSMVEREVVFHDAKPRSWPVYDALREAADGELSARGTERLLRLALSDLKTSPAIGYPVVGVNRRLLREDACDYCGAGQLAWNLDFLDGRSRRHLLCFRCGLRSDVNPADDLMIVPRVQRVERSDGWTRVKVAFRQSSNESSGPLGIGMLLRDNADSLDDEERMVCSVLPSGLRRGDSTRLGLEVRSPARDILMLRSAIIGGSGWRFDYWLLGT